MEDVVNPSLEASWRHPWRQDLHTGAAKSVGEVFRGTHLVVGTVAAFCCGMCAQAPARQY
ncbi:hypothetical protein [Halorhodospira halochloris]|uniref:hypothetical protein n=1 Tax=Halorhodospira halochloris TaxID=1052 RepID=UPI0013A5BC02|nr:hypothetical protein [Halorhodospira halochloris]